MWEDKKKRKAYKLLVREGLKIPEITKIVDVPISTLYRWKSEENWESHKFNPIRALEVRYVHLLSKENKSPKDFNEMSRLSNEIVKFQQSESLLSSKSMTVDSGNSSNSF